MDESLQAKLAVLANEVLSADMPSQCKPTAAWAIGQLPALYAKFHQSNDSRYREEIARLMQGVMNELTKGKEVGPGTLKLAATIMEGFQHLHEQFGLPSLELKVAVVKLPAARKPRATPRTRTAT